MDRAYCTMLTEFHEVLGQFDVLAVSRRCRFPQRVKSLALAERWKCRDGSPISVAPTPAKASEVHRDQRLKDCLHDTRADGEVLHLSFGIAHPMAVAPELTQHFSHALATRTRSTQEDERADDSLDTSGVLAQHTPQLIELPLSGTVTPPGGGGIEFGRELPGSITADRHCLACGKQRIWVVAAVPRTFGHLEYAERGELAKIRPILASEHCSYSVVRNIGDRGMLEKRTHQFRVIGDCL